MKVLIVGDGAELEALRAVAAQDRLPNVRFTGLVPREKVPGILAATDMALVTLKPSDVFKTVLPSKMFEAKPGFANYHKKVGGDDQEFIDAVDKGWGGELPFSVLYDRSGRKIKTLSGKHSYADYEREVSAALQGSLRK